MKLKNKYYAIVLQNQHSQEHAGAPGACVYSGMYKSDATLHKMSLEVKIA